ncbi:toxic anion resistance protein [Marinilabiliaceae bacterium JC017]|nr:toxic anion resistance protein [Marinilabiliaceae bacterium JC017]
MIEKTVDSNGEIAIAENPQREVDDIVARIQAELSKSPEVEKLSRQIDIRDHSTILEYGAKPAAEIGGFADKILSRVRRSDLEDSATMLKELAKLMKTFDPKDFDEDKGGLFGRFFSNTKKMIEKILAKYQTIGGEIDKIYREVNKYKAQISETNQVLEELYNHNFIYYEELEKHVVGGNLILNHIKENELPRLEAKVQGGTQLDVVNLENLKNSVEILEQRIYDLEMGKVVALQTAPQIRMIQKGNYKLLGKMQSAFVITIPVFKIGLVQAIALKKQKIVADSMEALDAATNDLLLRNAQNTAAQSAQIARLSSSSVKLETLQETWQTILQGIDETKAIEEENKRQRVEGTKKLHELQNSILDKFKK